MAYAHVTEFDSGDDRSTTNYDAFMERANAQGQPDGLIHHSSGFDGNGVFRMYEVWESSDQRQRFVKEIVEPILADGPVDPTRPDPPDREYGYELPYTTS
jgi:hypothetical protein